MIDQNHNVLFLTLDSCRYDTFASAFTPVMDGVGKDNNAQTIANYTYPAHTSFFAGHLPVVRDKSRRDFYTKEGAPLWKLQVARKNCGRAGVLLEGYSIQQGYRNIGDVLRGFGGTTFFAHKGQQLRKDYQEGEFTYFGQSTSTAPRPLENLPMSNVETIAASVADADKWFLFINSIATHVPYHVRPIDEELTDLINYASRLRAGRLDPNRSFDPRMGQRLHDLQVEAVEYVDQQLGKLLDMLPMNHPLVVVICGDHGESFGEKGRWGHLHNAPEVLSVPLIINPNYVHE